jgi:bifunctional non-homologous end joining protein LigD
VAPKPPVGERWVHEIKHDGYRLMVKRYGDKVRIFTRRGADWTRRFPAIVQAALKVKAKSFYIDGEGAVCDNNGLAVFDRLHRKATTSRLTCSRLTSWRLTASTFVHCRWANASNGFAS